MSARPKQLISIKKDFKARNDLGIYIFDNESSSLLYSKSFNIKFWSPLSHKRVLKMENLMRDIKSESSPKQLIMLGVNTHKSGFNHFYFGSMRL